MVKIFRKPTYTDSIIPFNLNHPRSQKLAAIRSMMYRAFNVPMYEEDNNNELGIIYCICSTNKYPKYRVDNVIKEFHNIKNPSSNTPPSNHVNS